MRSFVLCRLVRLDLEIGCGDLLRKCGKQTGVDRMQWRKSGIILAFVCWATVPAQCANLDKPISRIPTVGSEIKRGSVGAFDCSLKLVNELSALEYAQCVNSFVESDLASGPPSDAFLFGTYITSISLIKIHLKPEFSNTQKAYETHFAKEIYAKWLKRFSGAVSRTGYTMKDFCISVGNKDLKSCSKIALP